MAAAMTAAGMDPAIGAIRDVLKTEVIDILRREIAALKPLDRSAAYEAVMNQPTMLEGCLRLYRSRPDLFAQVAVDAERRPVASDDQPLRCGRTMAEVVALVVRASARRYFRNRLSPRPVHVTRPRPGMLERLGLKQPAPPPPARPARHTAADRLYQAVRDYLRFEWQVPLIPHYVPLTPEQATALGPRLLDVREPAELRALAGAEPAAEGGAPPLLLDRAERLLVKGQEAIDAEVLWRVCQQMDLARLCEKRDATQMRRTVAQVAATHPMAIAALTPVLGSDIRRFAAFLMVAHVTLGEQRFRQAFGANGHGIAVRRWAERLAKAEVPPPRLEDMKRVYQEVLSTAAAEPTAAGPAKS